MSPSEPLHPDELASAHLDGATSPEEAALVEGDPALLAHVARLAALRSEIAETSSLAEAVDASREPAVAAALAAFDALGASDAPPAAVSELAQVAARRGRSTGRSRWLVAAAVVAAAALAVPLVSQLGDDDPDQDADQLALEAEAGAGTDEDAMTSSAPAAEGGAPPQVADGQEAVGDDVTEPTAGPVALGDFADLAALETAVRSQLDSLAYGSGLAPDGATAPTTTAPGSGDRADCHPEGAAPPEDATERMVGFATVAGAPVRVSAYDRPDGTQHLVVVDAASCALVQAGPVPGRGAEPVAP